MKAPTRTICTQGGQTPVRHEAEDKHPFLAERVEKKEREVADLEETCAGLRRGEISWRAWNEDYTCGERQGAAIEESGLALDAARLELLELYAQLAGRRETPVLTGGK